MSNKILVIVVLGIVIAAGAGAAAALLYKNNNGGQLKMSEQTDQDSPAAPAGSAQSDQNNQPQNSPPARPEAAPTSTPQTANGCVRDFNPVTLKNAKVAIANRQVEINVKGFGRLVLELFDKDAPKTVENFLRLANSGYYNCLTFHRTGKDFMIQGGDPTGTGAGGDSAFGGKFKDELNPNTASYKTGYVKGVLAMANAGPNTNGSQFFILVADYPLDHSYTIFGRVISGQEIADKISKVATTNGEIGAPIEPVVMETVKIIK